VNEAQTLLDQLREDGAGGLERVFLEGVVALLRQDFALAERSFRNILQRQPGALRVRLELARTLFFEGKDEDADYHFKLAAAERPPPNVRANITRFREAIRARRAWRINVQLALAPDSNINAATSKDQVEVLGLPFQLNPSARARPGIGVVTGADATVRLLRSSKAPLYLAAFARVVRYSQREFDDLYVGGEAGPELPASGGRLRILATGLKRWYGDKPLVSSIGGRLNFDKVVGGQWSLEASLAARHNAYAGRDDVDGWDVEGALSVGRALGASTLGFAYADVQRSIAGDAGQSNWQARAGLAVLKEIGWGLRPQVAVEVGGQLNDARLALFGTTRRDWRAQLSASVYKRDWNIAGFAPSLRVTWTRNHSTISLYDERRVRAELGIARAF
jgi:hypothetical protein